MSWDVSIYSSKTPPAKVSEMPDDWAPEPLGQADVIRSKFLDVAPDIDWSDPTWGILVRDNFAIEISLGDEDVCQSVGLHARGDATVIPMVESLSTGLGWYALDMAHEEWFHHSETVGEGLAAFNEYREKVTKGPGGLGWIGGFLARFGLWKAKR